MNQTVPDTGTSRTSTRVDHEADASVTRYRLDIYRDPSGDSGPIDRLYFTAPANWARDVAERLLTEYDAPTDRWGEWFERDEHGITPGHGRLLDEIFIDEPEQDGPVIGAGIPPADVPTAPLKTFSRPILAELDAIEPGDLVSSTKTVWKLVSGSLAECEDFGDDTCDGCEGVLLLAEAGSDDAAWHVRESDQVWVRLAAEESAS